jgi:hypothetical protein
MTRPHTNLGACSRCVDLVTIVCTGLVNSSALSLLRCAELQIVGGVRGEPERHGERCVHISIKRLGRRTDIAKRVELHGAPAPATE